MERFSQISKYSHIGKLRYQYMNLVGSLLVSTAVSTISRWELGRQAHGQVKEHASLPSQCPSLSCKVFKHIYAAFCMNVDVTNSCLTPLPFTGSKLTVFINVLCHRTWTISYTIQASDVHIKFPTIPFFHALKVTTVTSVSSKKNHILRKYSSVPTDINWHCNLLLYYQIFIDIHIVYYF